MPRREGTARRSATEWSIRSALAIAAMIAGFLSVRQSLADVLKAQPSQAHLLAPGNGQITARLAQSLLLTSAKLSAADLNKIAQLARLALRQDATAVRAASTLGFVAQAQGDTPRARRLLSYAEKLSRRELQTQLWAIEDAVARNDIPEALRQYDIALRTTRTAPDVLFPVLAAAIDDAAIQAALTPILAKNPPWGPNFTLFASANSPPQAAVNLFLKLQAAGAPVTEEPNARLINRLIAGGFFDEAWRYYSTVRPATDRRISRDPHFTADFAIPTPYDWASVDAPGISSSIQSNPRGGSFVFSAPPTVGGPALQQLQMLPPGSYRIEGHSTSIDQPEGSEPYWALTCRDGRELGRVVVPSSAQTRGAFSGRFLVPAGCLVQNLMLVIRPSNTMSGSAGQIDYIRLFPAP